MIRITTVKNREKQEIQDSVIKRYESLEEKQNQTNEKINELNQKLDATGRIQKKKKEKKKILPAAD